MIKELVAMTRDQLHVMSTHYIFSFWTIASNFFQNRCDRARI